MKALRMPRPLCLVSAAYLMLGVALISGCGGSQIPQCTVTGKVTVDGQPVETGSIVFEPVAGDTPSGGGEIKAGTYSAVVPRGSHKVRINAPKVIGEKPSYGPGSPPVKTYAESLPAKYNANTELKFDADGSSATKDFELTAK